MPKRSHSPNALRSCKFQRTLSNTEIERSSFWRPWDDDDEQIDIDQSFVYSLCVNDNEEYNLNNFYDMVQQYEILHAYDHVIQHGGAVRGDQLHRYNFNLISTNQNENFGITQKIFEIETLEMQECTFEEAVQSLNEFFDQIMQTFVEPMSANDQLQINFNNESFKEGAISVGFLNKKDFNKKMLKQEFNRICHSYKNDKEKKNTNFMRLLF